MEAKGEDWLALVQEIAGVGIWDWRIDQPAAACTESNPVLYGLPAAKFMPPRKQWESLIHPDDRRRVSEELAAASQGVSQFHTEFRVVWPDGSTHWLAGKGRSFCDAAGKTVRLVGVNYDISRLKLAEHASKEAAEERAHQARHDVLTDLPNRRFLEEHLKHAVLQGAIDGQTLAVLYIDMDGFKVVNDSMGHAIGDELLRAVSDRLRFCVPESGFIARMGGDEFMMVLRGPNVKDSARSVASNVLTALQEPFCIANQHLYVTASVGISVYPDDGHEAGILQQNADIAMYRAKNSAKNGFQFFAAGMAEPMKERLELESALRGALQRSELFLHYQPLYGVGKDECADDPAEFEALLRWKHPSLGAVSPAAFIPIAEETGMIIPIGSWVLSAVCRQIRQWHTAGFENMRVNVNVSGIQFARPEFVEVVQQALKSNGVPGRCLGIEITESVLMNDFEVCSRKIQALQQLGVSISIDDFGAGYSSLAYLTRMPINALKIDGSFIREIGIKPTAITLIEAIVALAHSLNMSVVAECVETEQQMEAVLRAGCDKAQGFLLGKPIAPETITAHRQTVST